MTNNGSSYMSLIGAYKLQLVVEGVRMSTQQMKYARLDLGTIEAVINKLGGVEGVERFLRDELVVKMSERTWKTWKTIKLGTFKNVDEIREALKAGGYSIGDWANEILDKPTFKISETEQDVELVNVSVEGLGFKDGARYADICKRALELGLDLCPAEVGPQLRLQFKDQPKGAFVVVAMEAIADSDGYLFVFRVRRFDDGERYLGADDGDAGSVWRAYYHFVFLRRK